MSDSSAKESSSDPQTDGVFKILLSTGQAHYLKRVLPKQYSCQPDEEKLAKTRSKVKNYSKQLTELFNQARMQAASVEGSSDYSASKSKDEDREAFASEKPLLEDNQSCSREKPAFVSGLESKMVEVPSCRNSIMTFIAQLFQKKNLLKYYAAAFQTLRDAFSTRPFYSLQDLHSDMITILKNQEMQNSRSLKLAKTSLSKVYSVWRQNLDKNVTGATSIGVQTEKRLDETKIGQQEILRIEGESDDGQTTILIPENQNHKRAHPDFLDNFAQTNQASKRFCNSAREAKPVSVHNKPQPYVSNAAVKSPETVIGSKLKKKTSKVSSFSFASNALRKYNELSPTEQEELSQIAKQCQLSTIDITTIKNSPRVNIQTFLQAIDDLHKKKGMMMSPYDDRSISEEYLESSFEIEDED